MKLTLRDFNVRSKSYGGHLARAVAYRGSSLAEPCRVLYRSREIRVDATNPAHHLKVIELYVLLVLRT